MDFINLLGNRIEYIVEYTNNKRIYLTFKDDILIVKINRRIKLDIKQFLVENQNTIIRLYNKCKSRVVQKYDNLSLIYFYGKQYYLIHSSKNQVSEEALYVSSSNPLEGYLSLAKIYGIEFFKGRVNYYLTNYFKDITVNQIALRAMKTRFGVCNLKLKKITFNLHLARYPLEVIDYIIVHELAHFYVPNHSSEFYQVIAKVIPNYKLLEKKLKEIKL